MCDYESAVCSLVLFNSLMFIMGPTMMGFAIVVMINKDIGVFILANVPDFASGQTVEDMIGRPSLLEKASTAMLVIGILITIIGFVGCYGTLKEHIKMLYAYGVMIGCVIVVQIGIAYYAYNNTAKMEKYLKQYLDITITNYYDPHSYTGDGQPDNKDVNMITYAWDYVMAHWECCGNNDYTDFAKKIYGWNVTYTVRGETYKAPLPIMCCRLGEYDRYPKEAVFIDAKECLTSMYRLYVSEIGCYRKIKKAMIKNSKMLMGTALGVLFVEVDGLVSVLCIAQSAADKKKSQYKDKLRERHRKKGHRRHDI